MEKQPSTTSLAGALRQSLCDGVYWIFATLLFLAFRLCFKVRIVGLENCPMSGPLLIASNHISEWDPPFLGCMLPWQVWWLAKVELFELLGGKMDGFFRTLHCVPVD